MPMRIQVFPTPFEGLTKIQPESFEDDRGFFFESYSKRQFAEHGFDIDFVQDNHSRSRKGVIRGLHYQDSTAPQWRLVRCTLGKIWDAVVDLRKSSETYGKWFGLELMPESRQQLLIPPEFAHGFCVLSDVAEVQYKCSNHHSPQAERTLAWNDPDIDIRWPISSPTLSVKDRQDGQAFNRYRDDPAFL